MMRRLLRHLLGVVGLLAAASPAAAAEQNPIDRSDPAVIAKELQRQPKDKVKPEPAPELPTAPAEVALPGTFVAGAIRIEGAVALPPNAFAAVIEPYLGRPLAQDDLRALASDVANVAREAGFGLATAWVPAQRVSTGILEVRLDEGRIDEVETKGEAGAVAARWLRPLARGSPVRTAELERAILLVGDLAGVRVGKTRLERRPGRNVLIVDTRFDRIEAHASLDNWGSSAVGPGQLQLPVNINGLVSAGDTLRVGGVVTLFQPREFGLARALYRTPINRQGTEIALGGYYAYSNPGDELRARDFEGRSLQGEAELSHPILRTRQTSLWAYQRFTVRDSRQWREGERIRDDRVVTLSATAYAVTRLDGGFVRGRLTLSQGLDILGATQEADPLSSRFDGGGVFSKADYWIEGVKYLTEHLSVRVASEGQVASRPLLSLEEMGLGGRYFLRGYDFREFAGDKGVTGSLELRFDLAKLPKSVNSAQVYAYADAGSVGNLGEGTGGGSLASAGGGVRFRLKPALNASLEIGVPLADGFRNADRDPRLSFTLARHF